ncbi:MAG TPA: TadE/TadG family type IV pilus assembly protein [Hyphomicrobiaceae bacterium]|jgi:Flp pilus assembly protein TadG|nr:TadE/TadG family type IV pilus assembly protein [Hyphomicrobiaceae bacterium]
MFRTSLQHLTRRIATAIAHYRRDSRGVAAIEFAMIVPIMSAMFIGAVELSQAITVDRRVTQVASSTADLVARAEKQISHTEIGDIMKVGGYVLEPYSQTPLMITLRNVTSSPANATTTKQSWSCTYKGLDKSQSCACSNTLKSIPPNLLTTNDSVVVAEVSYGYKPLIFDFFMQRAAGGAKSEAGAYTLTETIYLKPRSQAAMLMQENNTPCPMPTF